MTLKSKYFTLFVEWNALPRQQNSYCDLLLMAVVTREELTIIHADKVSK